jgi:hypothetical protein
VTILPSSCAGLDPRIHAAFQFLDISMDCRVKPGNDDE